MGCLGDISVSGVESLPGALCAGRGRAEEEHRKADITVGYEGVLGVQDTSRFFLTVPMLFFFLIERLGTDKFIKSFFGSFKVAKTLVQERHTFISII